MVNGVGGTARRAARPAVNILVWIVVFLLAIGLLLFALPSILGGFTSLLVGAVQAVAGALTSLVVSVASAFVGIVLTIFFLPFEIIFNGVISAVNVVPLVDIDYWDLTGDAVCSGAPGGTPSAVSGRCAA